MDFCEEGNHPQLLQRYQHFFASLKFDHTDESLHSEEYELKDEQHSVKRSKRSFNLIELEEPKERRRKWVTEQEPVVPHASDSFKADKRMKFSNQDAFSQLLHLSRVIDSEVKCGK